MKVESHVTIQAPLDEVFSVFSDLENADNRISGITKIEILQSPAQMQVGTKWRETRIMFGKESTEVMWVTELVPGESYTVEAESHGTQYRSHHSFEETAEGVRVTMTFEGRPVSLVAKLMSFLFLFFVKPLKRCMEQDMIDLKKFLEQES